MLTDDAQAGSTLTNLDQYFCIGDSHALQNIENHERYPAQASYCLTGPLPKQIFIKDYPISPRNFGEKLRKARMDAGLKIKELANMLGVSEDTVINWEVRGITPTSQNLKEVKALFRRLQSDNLP